MTDEGDWMGKSVPGCVIGSLCGADGACVELNVSGQVTSLFASPFFDYQCQTLK